MIIKVLFRNAIAIIILLSCVANGQAQQSSDSLLDKAGRFYSFDQLDSATYYYRKVSEDSDKNKRLEGLAGLLKIAVFNSDSTAGALLITEGDQLTAEVPYTESVAKYFNVKGEFWKRFSRLNEALRIHKENARKSRTLKDKTLHADALLYTALAHEKLSQYDSAYVYAEEASKIFSTAVDTNSIRYGTICNSLGVCYFRANQLDKAKRYYKKAIQIAEDQLSAMSSDLSYANMNLAVILSTENDYQGAIRHMEKSLKINRALNDRDALSSNYYSLGVYYYYLGDYGRAKDYLEACIRLRKELFNNRHYRLIWPYQVLGIAIYESGDYQTAIDYNHKAAGILKHNYGPGSVDEGMLYENMALCYRHMGNLDSAAYYIKKANQILPKQMSSEDNALSIHYFSLAGINFEMGDMNKARESIQLSNQMMQAQGNFYPSDYAQNLALFALIEAESQNYDAADRLFEEALSRVRNGEEYFLTPQTFQVLGDYLSYNYDRYMRSGKDQYLNRSLEIAQVYTRLSDNFRKQFNDPYTKSILIRYNAQVFSEIIGIYNKLYQQTKDPQYIEAAYKAAEHNRTTMLRDMLDNQLTGQAGLPDSIVNVEKNLRAQLSELNQSYHDYPDSTGISDRLFQAKEAFNRHEQFLADNHPEYYNARFANNLTSLDEVQQKLDANTCLIEYMHDGADYYGLMITKDKITLNHIGKKSSVDTSVIQWRNSMLSFSDKKQKLVSLQLYESLLGSILSETDAKQLVIIPSGALYYLSFDALLEPESDKYLIEKYTISYALSAHLIVTQSRGHNEKIDAVSLAFTPGFEDDLKENYVNALDSLDEVDQNFLYTVRQPWSVRLANHLKKEYKNKAYTGQNASESKVKSEISKGKVLVFGTHAISNAQDPLRSKLVLAKEVGPQTEDGYLHAYEIYGMNLNADLAILTACESGLGELKEGEGMISLAYSLNFAGCPNTIMSLWKIDEKSNTYITGKAFENIADGMKTSEALRRAKLDFIDNADPILRHPYFWSGLVLTGADGPINLPANRNHNGFLIGLLILLVLTIVYYLKK